MFRRSLTLMLVFLLLCVSAINARPPVIPQPNSDRLLPKIEIEQIRTGRAPGNFTVNRTDDTIDVNLGDGICADSDGLCSIRAAVQESNALEPGSTVSVPAGTYVLTVVEDPTLFQTSLIVTQTMTITGAGVGQTIIDGNATSTVLSILDTSTDTLIQDMTITGGSGFVNSATESTVVGGVYNAGINTQLRQISIEDNHADDIGGFGNEVDASAIIENSAIINNQALTGAEHGSGGIGSFSTLMLKNVTVSDNTSARRGGAMILYSAQVMLDTVTVASNYSGSGGAIIFKIGTLTITNSTISGNITDWAEDDLNGGGAIKSEHGGTLNISNSTISGNTTYGMGGAIMHFGQYSPHTYLNNVTIAYNYADGGYGGLLNYSGTFHISNSILAMNSAPHNPNCNGMLDSTGDNLIGDTTDGCTGAPGDLTDVDPLLEPLAVSPGAVTATHALQALSPALDAANDTTCEPVDQRGMSRPQREGCDIGAYEAERELIINGDFETLDAEDKPDITPWIIKNASGEKAKCNKDKDGDGIPDKIYAYTGNCAFAFKGAVGEAGKLEQTIDMSNISVVVGDTLNLTFAAKTSSGGAGKAKVVFKYSDDTKTKISVDVGDTAEVYQSFAGSGTITRTKVVKSKVSYKHTTEVGKMYVDTVSLRLISGVSGVIPLPEPAVIEIPSARLNSRK